MDSTKTWLSSRTLWVNAIAIASSFVAPKLGVVIDAETQIAILGVINLILRIITKQPITFT